MVQLHFSFCWSNLQQQAGFWKFDWKEFRLLARCTWGSQSRAGLAQCWEHLPTTNMTRFDFRTHHHNIFVDWVYWFSTLFWILRFPPPGTPRGYYSQGFWGTREHEPVSGKLMWEQLKILFEGRCWLWGKVVGRFVEQGTNLEKLWAHGNTGQIFWKGTRTPGRPSNTCCIACFTKR